MTKHADLLKILRLILFTLLFTTAATAVSSIAKEPPQNCSAVSAQLGDSTALNGKVVYVDFWASWCVPCRKSFPWMQSLYEKYHDKGLEIVAVNVDKDHKSAVKFLDDNKAGFTILYDSTGTLAKLYDLQAMPSSFLYGRDGKLIMNKRGFTEEESEDVEKGIIKLLAGEKSR